MMRIVLPVLFSLFALTAKPLHAWTLFCPNFAPYEVYKTMVEFPYESEYQYAEGTNPYNEFTQSEQWLAWRIDLKQAALITLKDHLIREYTDLRDDIEDLGFDITYTLWDADYWVNDDEGCQEGSNGYTFCMVAAAHVFPAEVLFCSDQYYTGYNTFTPWEEGVAFGGQQSACEEAQSLAYSNAVGQHEASGSTCVMEGGIHYEWSVSYSQCQCALLADEYWGCSVTAQITGKCKVSPLPPEDPGMGM